MSVVIDPSGDTDFDSMKGSSELRAVLDGMAALRKPVGRSEAAFRLRQKDLIPEGVAFDPGSGTFYVGSVRRRTIVAIDAKGVSKPFVRERADGLGSVLGLQVDPPRRALWACSAALPQMEGYTEAERGQTGAFQLALATGKLMRKVTLPAPEPASPRQCNDLTVSSAGDVYVSDGSSGAVYVLRAGEAAFAALIAPGGLGSPQGLALSADEQTLFIADYRAGIVNLDLKTRVMRPLAHADEVTLLGVDGLDLHGGDLIVIQNGINPHRVVRLTLSEGADRVTRAEILEMNNPLFDEPTLGVVAGGWFHYVANSQWGRFNKDGTLFPMDKLAEPVILKMKL
jgi:sugar lactone lactonase YvrE